MESSSLTVSTQLNTSPEALDLACKFALKERDTAIEERDAARTGQEVLLAQVVKLTNRNVSLEKDNVSAKEELLFSQKEYAEFKCKNQELLVDESRLKSENADLEAQVDSLQTRLVAANSEIEQMADSLENSSKKNEVLESEKYEALAQAAKFKAQVGGLKQKLEEVNSLYKQSCVEIRDTRKVYKETAQQLLNLKSQNAREKESNKRKIADLEEELESKSSGWFGAKRARK